MDYHAAVLRGVTGQANQTQPLPSGSFVLDIAAHDEVYSAPVVFLRVAHALFSVFKLRGALNRADIELDLVPRTGTL
ncbi:hypothetical protein [Deinococcus sp. QL22]|uniref:hypothetical protein n=1 Tax=Deinococcus sp. QL22 TaxID=2939437 RepID=UPI0020171FEE|nr:hypothetical protein [Deinococcus sp. QL22]UQN10576.1 hypothetical protein M1R55_30725 [Deinococcus sp. QL22]